MFVLNLCFMKDSILNSLFFLDKFRSSSESNFSFFFSVFRIGESSPWGCHMSLGLFLFLWKEHRVQCWKVGTCDFQRPVTTASAQKCLQPLGTHSKVSNTQYLKSFQRNILYTQPAMPVSVKRKFWLAVNSSGTTSSSPPFLWVIKVHFCQTMSPKWCKEKSMSPKTNDFLVEYHGLTQGARSPIQGGSYGETMTLNYEPVEKRDVKCKAPGPKQLLKNTFPSTPVFCAVPVPLLSFIYFPWTMSMWKLKKKIIILFFTSVSLNILDISYRWNPAVFVPLWLAYFLGIIVLRVHSSCHIL